MNDGLETCLPWVAEENEAAGGAGRCRGITAPADPRVSGVESLPTASKDTSISSSQTSTLARRAFAS
jgi:hypothetical protein